MRLRTKFKTGQVILFSEGTYSNYRVGPLFRCLKDVDLVCLARDYYAQAPAIERSPDGRKATDGGAFLLWMCVNGFAEEVDYMEVECDSYYSFKCCGVTISPRP